MVVCLLTCKGCEIDVAYCPYLVFDTVVSEVHVSHFVQLNGVNDGAER